MQIVKQLLCSTRELLLYCNYVTDTQILYHHQTNLDNKEPTDENTQISQTNKSKQGL